MKIEILRESLKSGLGIIERNLGKNLSLPILDDVLIVAEEGFLNLISTNFETTIKLWILSKIIKNGRVAVPARIFSSYISSLPNDKIAVEQNGQGLKIECGELSAQIQGHNPDDFPIIPKISVSHTIEVGGKDFYNGLSVVACIVSPSQSRPEISGVYVSFSKNILKIAATDSFRLAEKNIV